MIAIYSINGVVPTLQPLVDGYQVTESDLLASGSGRSAETGKVLRYPIRLNVYKLNLKFKGKSEEIAQVANLVNKFEQEVEFDYFGQRIKTKMYPSDRTITNNGFIAELSVNLIEI